MADNLLTNTVLASTCPVLLAPAMNTEMWQQLAVQRNWQQLLTDSAIMECIQVMDCWLAIASVPVAWQNAEILPIFNPLHTSGKRDLLGKRVLISAGEAGSI